MPNKKLFTILIFVLLFLLLLKLNQLVAPKPTATPAPTILLYSPEPTIIVVPTITTSTVSLNDIISVLPIETEEYTIQYLPKTKKFIVMILENPFEENKKKVEEWFKEQGVEDLSELNISFGSSRGVAP